jgi:serine protease AprX
MHLEKKPTILAVSRDATMRMTGTFSNTQLWPDAANVSSFWVGRPSVPTIAIVDSGVDAGHPDLSGRVTQQVTFTTLLPNSSGDGRGHGTLVASIAAGSGVGYAGAAPQAKIISLDVLNDNGEGLMSDVIAAADWLYANKSKYNIRVANFSLNSAEQSSFMYDPLAKAVEKLWLSGMVVVTAAGNTASGGLQSGVQYAPANDPFVITVGAVDIAGTVKSSDDFAAPWSSFGYTLDGFSKPEIAAPGRYMNGAVSAGSTMRGEHPERLVDSSHMWMSGTSFAAPVVAGAAAQILAVTPTLTPDQVKGALMLKAEPGLDPSTRAFGVGIVKADAASAVVNAPNPNAGLNQFLVPDPNGTPTPVFDNAAWSSAAWANAAWNSAAWSSAAWSSSTTADAAWSSAAWSTSIYVQ